MADDYGLLRINTRRAGRVTDVTRFLSSVETAYNHLYALDLIGDRCERYLNSIQRQGSIHGTPIESIVDAVTFRPELQHTFGPIDDVDSVIPPQHRLLLNQVEIRSPGFWEFLGTLNPLEVIRQYLKDRHERRKDRDYREGAERVELLLKNHRAAFELLRDKAEFYKSLGFSEERLWEILKRHAFDPIAVLDVYQDNETIDGAELQRLEAEPELEYAYSEPR